ncbi:HAD-IA family hydrolase [Candidatus Gottesmanbacteria bacterium]|nr:HAD-IA family hydrolase [Candidatus Gottesmanbacteria bacterium]
MYKCILFDLGGVLFTNGTKRFIANLSQRYSISQDRIGDIIDGKIGSDYREAKISRYKFWEKVIGQLNLKETADQLEKEWIGSYELVEGTYDIILKLRLKYELYYLSDNVRERVEILNQNFNFLKLFKGGIFSHEVGVRKPNPLIYRLAIEKAKCNVEMAVYIDDKEKFLIPAREMGMTTLHFINPEKLGEDLIKLEIL